MNWFQLVAEWLSQYPNVGATIFGVVGTFAAAFFGFLLKRPLQKQAVQAETFKVQVDGYERLIKTLDSRISYYESRESVRDAYEADILRRLRECEDRHNLPRSC